MPRGEPSRDDGGSVMHMRGDGARTGGWRWRRILARAGLLVLAVGALGVMAWGLLRLGPPWRGEPSEPLDAGAARVAVRASEGGSVAAGGAVVRVPPGALSADATVAISPASPPPEPLPAPMVLVGGPFEIVVEGAQVVRPVTIELAYEPRRFPEGALEDLVFVAYYDASAGRWVPVFDGEVDVARKVVAVRTAHLSLWGAFTWNPSGLLGAALDAIRDLANAPRIAAPPVCPGPLPPGAVLEFGDLLPACLESSGQQSATLRVVNVSAVGTLVRLQVSGGSQVRLASRTRGGLLEEALGAIDAKAFGANFYLPPGGQAELSVQLAAPAEIRVSGEPSLLPEIGKALVKFFNVVTMGKGEELIVQGLDCFGSVSLVGTSYLDKGLLSTLQEIRHCITAVLTAQGYGLLMAPLALLETAIGTPAWAVQVSVDALRPGRWAVVRVQPSVVSPTPTPALSRAPLPGGAPTVVPTPSPIPATPPPHPAAPSPTPAPTLACPPASLPAGVVPPLDPADLRGARWEWDQRHEGGWFVGLPPGAKIVMPFDGYVAPVSHWGFGSQVDGLHLISQDFSIALQLLGHLNYRDINPNVTTNGYLHRAGSVLAEVMPPTPEQRDIFRVDEPFLVVYAYVGYRHFHDLGTLCPPLLGALGIVP